MGPARPPPRVSLRLCWMAERRNIREANDMVIVRAPNYESSFQICEDGFAAESKLIDPLYVCRCWLRGMASPYHMAGGWYVEESLHCASCVLENRTDRLG